MLSLGIDSLMVTGKVKKFFKWDSKSGLLYMVWMMGCKGWFGALDLKIIYRVAVQMNIEKG